VSHFSVLTEIIPESGENEQLADEWNDAAVRRFIVRVGEENLAKMYQLRRADDT
jgi:hypothetical protein